MEWGRQQETALTRINQWYKSGGTKFALGGLAGTGKTTLAKHIAQNIDGVVASCAFTGKAASVLREKGMPGATTIHKLIYNPKGNVGESVVDELQNLIQAEALKDSPDQAAIATWRADLVKAEKDMSAIFERKVESDIQQCSLVIVDECSMVDRRMGLDLEAYGKPVLYLGDPGQLAPVMGKPHLRENDYDFVLTDIHRQAKDNPIIWLSHNLRDGKGLEYGSFGDGRVNIMRKSEWDLSRVVESGQVITGMNNSRFRLTRAMRSFIGFDQLYPVAGDKLQCRKNDHEKGLLNGVIAKAVGTPTKRGNIVYLDVEYDGRVLERQICDPGYFQEHYGQRENFPKGDGISHFDYGYVITGHRSQGSQWDHLTVADDKMRVNDVLNRKQWQYTVVTRAAEQLDYYV